MPCCGQPDCVMLNVVCNDSMQVWDQNTAQAQIHSSLECQLAECLLDGRFISARIHSQDLPAVLTRSSDLQAYAYRPLFCCTQICKLAYVCIATEAKKWPIRRLRLNIVKLEAFMKGEQKITRRSLGLPRCPGSKRTRARPAP